MKTLETLKHAPFNKMRMCVFPKDYTFSRNEPPYHAFERDAEGAFDFARFNPAFFQHLEQRIGDLRELGIEADLILFHPYDRWGYATMPADVDDRYLRYVVARLAAYRNIWWSMANEYDLMKKPDEEWERYFRTIQTYDPYQHLSSIHNGMAWYNHSKPWITHLSVQTPYMEQIQDWRKLYNKPVMIDEFVYEGNIPNDWGNLTPEETVNRFWIIWARGAYGTHGETYIHPQNILWWSKGGKLYGKSPERLAFLHQIMAEAPQEGLYPFHNLWNKETYLIKDDQYYLFYYGNSQQALARLRLPEQGKYKLEVIDAWNMTVMPVEGVFSGRTEIPLPGRPYVAVRATAVK
jgi:hypothetical protein